MQGGIDAIPFAIKAQGGHFSDKGEKLWQSRCEGEVFIFCIMGLKPLPLGKPHGFKFRKSEKQ